MDEDYVRLHRNFDCWMFLHCRLSGHDMDLPVLQTGASAGGRVALIFVCSYKRVPPTEADALICSWPPEEAPVCSNQFPYALTSSVGAYRPLFHGQQTIHLIHLTCLQNYTPR